MGVTSFARSGGKIKIRGAKVFAEIRRLFLPEIAIFPQKSRDLRRNPKTFSGQNRKFQRFFRPKTPTQKYTVGGQEKNWGSKNENRGGIAPLPPRWRRAWVIFSSVARGQLA